MSVSTGNAIASDHRRQRFHELSQTFTLNPTTEFQATAQVDVLNGATEAWIAPLAGLAKASVELSLTVRMGTRVLARSREVLASRETPGFHTSGPVARRRVTMTCAGEFPSTSRQQLTADVRLTAVANVDPFIPDPAGFVGGASAWAAIAIPSISIESCCAGRPRPDGSVPLYRWFSSERGDNFSTPNWAGCGFARRSPNYRFAGIDGWVFPPGSSEPGTVPLFHWHSPGREDNFVTTRWPGVSGVFRRPDYRFIGILGHVFPAGDDRPGTVPLFHWFSPDRGDNLTMTRAVSPGLDYRRVGIIGRVLPN